MECNRFSGFDVWLLLVYLELSDYSQLHWQFLVHDNEIGTLNLKITERSIRDSMAKILKPNPELSELLESNVQRRIGSWGIINRIWPNTKYLQVAVPPCRKKNVLLSIKFDEAELQSAVQSASQLLHEFNTAIVEFTSYADTIIKRHRLVTTWYIENFLLKTLQILSIISKSWTGALWPWKKLSAYLSTAEDVLWTTQLGHWRSA